MTNSELSKRNQEFIFHLTKLLSQSKSFNDEKTNSTIAELQEKLLTGQKTGKTARQLFGTPTEYFQDLTDPKAAAARRKKLAQQGHHQAAASSAADARRPKITEQLFEYSFWTEFLDTAWTLLIMFSAMYALTAALGTSSKKVQGVGLVSLFVLSIVAGAVYVFATRVLSPDPSKKRTAASLAKNTVIVVGVGGSVHCVHSCYFAPSCDQPGIKCSLAVYHCDRVRCFLLFLEKAKFFAQRYSNYWQLGN